MSVLECDRYGCESIMCDRLSPIYGYICASCFEELVELGVETNIQEFMKSDPKERDNEEKEEIARRRFEHEFDFH